MIPKQRLSASVDADLIAAAEAAVLRGTFDSVSAWVNDALRLKLEQDRRLEALGAFVAAYEAEHGEIRSEEIRDAARRARAVITRPAAAGSAASRRARAATSSSARARAMSRQRG
jgi:Arc/MetJ-type ribon-helix-helix transcriptional regulator